MLQSELNDYAGRDATIEYSPDGVSWVKLNSTLQKAAEPATSLAKAAGAPRVQEQRHTARRHLRAVRLWRARQITRTIPTDLPLKQYLQCRAYVAKAVSLFGRRGLSRVAWPWLPRQKDAGKGKPCPGRARRQALAVDRTAGIRTARGRLANPTALR